MTKQGSFKRAVRKRARETGQRYTEVRAAMDRGETAARPVRPFDHAALKEHLEQRYNIRIASMEPITRFGWKEHPSTLHVKREDGPAWVARIFSSSADTVSRVEGDAEILRFLASHDFPAERLAHDEPVTVLDGAGVIVTEFVEGDPLDEGRIVNPEQSYGFASILGRLHALPAGTGAVARDGGSDEYGGGFFNGRPKQNLAAAMSALLSVEDDVAPEGRTYFDWLQGQVEDCDDAEGLPEALTHGNYHAWAAVGTRDNLVIVGWAGAGRGPRLPAFAFLARTSFEGGTEQLDATIRGYREHVQLTDEELERLPSVLNMKPLWLACHEYKMYVENGHTPTGDEPGWVIFKPEHGEQLAAHVTRGLR